LPHTAKVSLAHRPHKRDPERGLPVEWECKRDRASQSALRLGRTQKQSANKVPEAIIFSCPNMDL
jgi:hypothetical protein